MPKSQSQIKFRRNRNQRCVLTLERLEERRLLACDLSGTFPGGTTHQIDLSIAEADNQGTRCITNSLSPDLIFSLRNKNQSVSPTHDQLRVDVLRGGTRIDTAINMNPSGVLVVVNVADVPLNEGNNVLSINLVRITLPSAEQTATATFTNGVNIFVDTVAPTASIDTAISSPRNTPVAQFEVTFSETIQNTSFTRDDLSLTRDGGANLISSAVHVSLKSGSIGTFVVSGLAGLTNVDGNYSLTVNSAGVMDIAGNSGIGTNNVQWKLDTSPPTADDPPHLRADDDSGRSQSDAITNVNRDLTFTSVVDGALMVQFQIRSNSGTLVAAAPGRLSGTNSYETAFSDTLADGTYQVVTLSSDNLNPAVTSPALTLVIDTTSPLAPLLLPGVDGVIEADIPNEIMIANTEINAEVALSRNAEGVVQMRTPPVGQAISRLSDVPVVNANGETFQYTAVQTDIAGNTSVSSAPFVAVVDPVLPTLSKFALATSDNAFPNSVLPVSITRSTRPVMEVQLGDQQYSQLENVVRITLFADDDLLNPIGSGVAGFAPQALTSFGPNKNATQKVQVTLLPGVELEAGKQHDLTFVASDAAGNVGKLVKEVFVLAETNATKNAPGTPVFTETFFIGANVLEVRSSQNQIVVDQQIPTGYAINIAASRDPIRVVNSVTDSVSGRTTLTLKLTSTDTLSKVKLNDKVAWLRPWQMSFDKTTQTVWFTMEDGHHLGQFDPSTGSVEIHDVSIPSAVVRNADGALMPTADAKPTAFDPHGVFFDFDTHLTPRVWFVYRNQVEGGVSVDDAPEDSVNDTILRVSYYDVALKKLFTFDFNEIAGVFDIEAHHDDETISTGGTGGGTGGGRQTQVKAESSNEALSLKVGHAVFVDAKGSVWITAEDSGTIVELNFDNPSVGSRPATLNNLSAKATAHVIPKSFGSDPSISTDFHVHGVQSIVDERDGSTYVWMVNGNVKEGKSTQSLALLLPGETERWYEFAVPRSTDSGSHLLFTAFDDNETPGIPEDDRLVFTDSGFSFTSIGDGIVAIMEVGEIIRAIQQRGDVTKISPRVRSIQIPKLPGAAALSVFSAPNQAFVDRGGTTFVIDPQGGVARLNLDEFSDAQMFPTNATVSKASQTPQHARITLHETAMVSTVLKTKLDATPGTDPARSVDRSQMAGIDQYEVASVALRRGNGEGPFRGALNAANTLYGSISQSDHISTTIFAESARRQMSAVVSPLASPSGAITQARMAFQVLRNGSLVLTARGDAKIADGQINLLGKMVTDNRITAKETANFLIIGEASAVTMPDGSVHLMGRSPRGGVVQYTFTPDGNDWAHDDLFNTANWNVTHREILGILLAEDTVPAGPLGFSATTSDGHWIAIPINPNAPTLNLTVASGNVNASRVYSAVAVTPGDNGVLFGYGTNQTGNLIEYRIDGNSVTTRQIDATSRETRVMRNVRAVTMPNGIRHVFATDGTSRLVHYTIDSSGVQQENISQKIADNGQNFGYFPFQQRFSGRIYTYVAPLVEDDGTIRIYGTNGGDLIEFTQEKGVWRVANLTANTNGTFGDNSLPRVPANSVFGGPTAYIDAKGGRHILQINAQGEVVEYYTFGKKLFPNTTIANQINSQNVNFFTGKSSTDLSNELPIAVLDAMVFSSPIVIPAQSILPPVLVAAPEDVNHDGVVTALDALLVINHLPRISLRSAVESENVVIATGVNLAFDVNGDKSVTPLDALKIINYIARKSRQHGQAAAAEQYESAVNDDKRSTWELSVDDVISDLKTQLF